MQAPADFMVSGPQIGHNKKNAKPLHGVIQCDLFARKNSDVCIHIGFLVAIVQITIGLTL
jgi:hypothetical protein